MISSRTILGCKPILLLLVLQLVQLTTVAATEYELYYLGGQSNMDGYGYVSELPAALQPPVDGVMIFHGNPGLDAAPLSGDGVWHTLQPGHGVGFRADAESNHYSERFGIELTFAEQLKQLRPHAKIALIKYSRGGTSIHADAAGEFGCWEPDFAGGIDAGEGVNQYDHFLATIRNATSIRDIDGDGTADQLVPMGIVWMQGESDAAHSEAIANAYEANLKRLMDLVRATLRVDDLPVVIGRISDSGRDETDHQVWDHGHLVRQAQARFCSTDESAALVTTTDQYHYSDAWHYDTAGYIDLGRQFATALHQLINVPRKSAATSGLGHRVILQGNDQLAILDRDGNTEWSMPWGDIHDLHVLPNGNIMVQAQMKRVVEIDPQSKSIVWSYDAEQRNGNQGQRVEVHAFQPLEDGNIMIAESGPARIIEIDRDGNLKKSFPLKVEKPNAHTDTRLARKLRNGNYLVCHENDGMAREYDATGKVVWEYRVPMFGQTDRGGHGPKAFGNRLFTALRLDNGNTLIATGNGHSIIEVTPAKTIVWQVHQRDLPGIVLGWVTTLEQLPNGNIVVGNCHAGPNQPLLIEINRVTKQVVWTLDGFDRFGNSVSNSHLLDVETLR